MALNRGWTLAVSAVAAAVSLWSAPARATSCDEQLTECLYWANQETDSYMRDVRTEQCYQQHNYCLDQSTWCGDGACRGEESCANCTADCGTGNSTQESTSTSGCTYSYSSRWLGFGHQVGEYCEYPVYEDGYRTCHVYRTTTVHACNAPPTTTTVYEGTSTEYVPSHWVGAVREYGKCYW